VGWLRDLILESPARVGGFDHLARVCLQSADWPATAKIGHRSLGAIFGRLDREENLEWLESRPGVQTELAKVLGVDRNVIQDLLGGGAKAGEAVRLVTLESLPFARGLDLLEEDLFPGIPLEVLHPRDWGDARILWVCPSGGGRSLVGRLLRARGLLRAERPQYRELETAMDLDLSTVAPGTCIALTEEAAEEAFVQVDATWKVVRSASIVESLESLVEWARARLSAASTWDTKGMVEALRRHVERGVARSAGDVLGLIGVADGMGLAAFSARPLERVARDWLKRRASERLDRDGPVTGWMKTQGYDALVALVRRVATDDDEPLSAARELDEWADLLPGELKRGADLEWLKVALTRAEPSLRPVDLERVSAELPPEAFKILRALEVMGVLQRGAGDGTVLRPHWLVRVALADAVESVVGSAAFDWGEALLSPILGRRTLEGLFARARAGELSGEEIEPEPPDESEPAAAASVEGAVRALGIARLLSRDVGEAPETLWDEQLRLVVDLGDGPRPRWDRDPPEGGLGAWLSTPGAWHLAVLALGELLPDGVGMRHPVLRPWQESAAPPGLPLVLDSVLASLRRGDAPEAVIGPAVALVGRLRGVLGPLGAGGSPHVLERAVIVADEVSLGVLSFASFSALRGDRVGAMGLVELVRQRELPAPKVAAAVFQAFEDGSASEEAAEVLFDPVIAEWLLPLSPVSVLVKLLPRLSRKSEISLADETWRALLSANVSLDERVARSVPRSALDLAVDRVLGSGAGDTEKIRVLSVLWGRFPNELQAIVEGALTGRDRRRSAHADVLLRAAPAAAALEMLQELAGDDLIDTLLRAPAESLMALRRYLHKRLSLHVGAATREFRTMYALFDDIERRCAKVPPS
jgi:hypothetical protein